MTNAGAGVLRNWQEVRRYAERRGARGLARELVDEFGRNRLLTYASAISYQLLFALVPALLAAVAVLGFLDLSSVWQDDLAPRVQERLSSAAFTVVDNTVERVLGSQQGYWLTLGLAFALWQLSGAVRATMGALNDIYGANDERGLLHRVAISLALAGVAALGGGGALLALEVVPRLGELGGTWVAWAATAAGWLGAFGLLVLVVGTLLRVAPAVPQSLEWLGFVTTVVVVGWLLASAGFVGWAVKIVSYGSIYGGFAVVILLMTYVYLLAVVFLLGVQIDALVRRRSGDRDGRGS